MKFDFQLPVSVLVLMICCLLFPVLQSISFPLFDGMTVTAVESIQALLLLFFAIFTFFYIRPLEMQDGKKQFWLWAVAWWLLLFGRSISWGRDYFPDVPKPYFRLISVFMIAPVVFMLFSPYLRQEIVHKLKTLALPIWPFGLVILGLFISDAVEHSRSLSFLFLYDLAYKDFIEEVYEFPLIFGLFLTAYPWLQHDHVPQELEVMQYHKE
ncbi:hypothetical protein [Acinetobacter sp. CFCC 11171]|uniref:hypothetical protein n=1 Tax=Acinetobacter sp. CFCC 11171 TaxID=1775558 RepID=UPI000DD0A099|nr:hypothetical protein [Acinetobacter sp. CFCC 11171]